VKARNARRRRVRARGGAPARRAVIEPAGRSAVVVQMDSLLAAALRKNYRAP
jgi:hypothetical protein